MFYSEEPYQYERIKNFIPCRIGMNEKIDLFADTELGGGLRIVAVALTLDFWWAVQNLTTFSRKRYWFRGDKHSLWMLSPVT